MTRICLVRHGETDWNAERRLQGHIDVPLNATGVAQARATAANLAEQDFTAVYTSDLQRARQTAAEAARSLALDPQPEPRLRERHYGNFQGLTYAEAQTRYPEGYRRFQERDPSFTFGDDGESLEDFAGRIRTALEALAERHAGEQILVVTHGGVLDIAHRLASGKPLDSVRDFTIPNAALNWIEYTGDGWRLLAWAQQDHLTAARDELPNA
jgi:2,3-bisphosphoglycerate-dependent phosphoglycerate mutase